VHRPKQGFILPFEKWLAGDLAPVVQDGMRALSSRGWIRPETPDAVWRAWKSGAAHWTRPWGLGVLGLMVTGS